MVSTVRLSSCEDCIMRLSSGKYQEIVQLQASHIEIV